MAVRGISLPRSKSVSFGGKQTPTGWQYRLAQ
jgi:hypothetical protein